MRTFIQKILIHPMFFKVASIIFKILTPQKFQAVFKNHYYYFFFYDKSFRVLVFHIGVTTIL